MLKQSTAIGVVGFHSRWCFAQRPSGIVRETLHQRSQTGVLEAEQHRSQLAEQLFDLLRGHRFEVGWIDIRKRDSVTMSQDQLQRSLKRFPLHADEPARLNVIAGLFGDVPHAAR